MSVTFFPGSSGATRAEPGGRFTAIVAAMPEEIAPLRARATDARRVRLPPDPSRPSARVEIELARLEGRAVALAVTGDGERNAREGMAALLAAVPVERVLAIGVAGALSPELEAHALVVSERVVDELGAVWTAEPSSVERAAGAASARPAIILSAARIVDTVDEKRRLLASTRAAAGGAAAAIGAVADLESAAFAEAAARAELPWLVLRAVSDAAHESLPPLLNRCRDEGGAVRRGRVARALLSDPRALPMLLMLRERVRRCAEVLDRATVAVLRACQDVVVPSMEPIAPPRRSQGRS